MLFNIIDFPEEPLFRLPQPRHCAIDAAAASAIDSHDRHAAASVRRARDADRRRCSFSLRHAVSQFRQIPPLSPAVYAATQLSFSPLLRRHFDFQLYAYVEREDALFVTHGPTNDTSPRMRRRGREWSGTTVTTPILSSASREHQMPQR